jgi:peptidoglycan hydrolase-like protein with peptidoglycan-binding domain
MRVYSLRASVQFVGKDQDLTVLDTIDASTFDSALEAALRDFQTTFGLPVDGTLNDPTLALMQAPRCGVPETAAPVCPWGPRALKYHLAQHLPRIGRDAHLRAFVDGLNKWARGAQGRITFSEGPLGSQIQSFLYSGNGCAGVYAYAYFPCSGAVSGDMHFDRWDCWSAVPDGQNTPPNTVDFVSVMLHELGHALGLGHEPSVRNAVMYPYFSLGEQRRTLHTDDVRGIRRVYP